MFVFYFGEGGYCSLILCMVMFVLIEIFTYLEFIVIFCSEVFVDACPNVGDRRGLNEIDS